jgi:hypothetical protein
VGGHQYPLGLEVLDESSTFEEAREHVGALRYLVRKNIPPRRYVSHITLISSICEPSSALEEERCDTLMEDDDGVDSMFVINGSVVDYMDMVVGYS